MLASVARQAFAKQMPRGAVRPFEGFPLDVAHRFPWTDLVDHLGFEEANDALGQCIIVGVAHGSDREIDVSFSQPLGILYRQVLRSAVRVVNQVFVIRRFPLPDSLLKRIRCPAGDLARQICREGSTNCVFMDVEVRQLLPERDLRANHAGLRSALQKRR